MLVWFELPERGAEASTARRPVVEMFLGFERTESRRRLPPPPRRVTDDYNGSGRRWSVLVVSLERQSVVVVERSDVSGSFVERSRQSPRSIGCCALPPPRHRGCWGRMGYHSRK